MNNYVWLIPEKLIPALNLIKKKPPPFKGFNMHYLCEIISVICFNSRKDQDYNLYASLHMQTLRNLIPLADKYIKYLREESIIIRHGSYTVGSNNFNYSISDKYFSRFRLVSVDSSRLCKRIHEAKKKYGRRNSRKYPNQNKYIRKMTIEYEAALKFIRSHPRFEDDNKYNYAFSRILNIKKKRIYYRVNKTNNRYDSNLTGLPRELRQFIRINGKPIRGTDISNSQPYLLSLALLNPDKIGQFYPGKFPINRLKSVECSGKKDVEEYFKLVSSGKLLTRS